MIMFLPEIHTSFHLHTAYKNTTTVTTPFTSWCQMFTSNVRAPFRKISSSAQSGRFSLTLWRLVKGSFLCFLGQIVTQSIGLKLTMYCYNDHDWQLRICLFGKTLFYPGALPFPIVDSMPSSRMTRIKIVILRVTVHLLTWGRIRKAPQGKPEFKGKLWHCIITNTNNVTLVLVTSSSSSRHRHVIFLVLVM